MPRFRIQGTAIGRRGATLRVLQGATVEVRTPNGALATVYRDNETDATFDNPFQVTGPEAAYDFYTADDVAYYDLLIASRGQNVDQRVPVPASSAQIVEVSNKVALVFDTVSDLVAHTTTLAQYQARHGTSGSLFITTRDQPMQYLLALDGSGRNDLPTTALSNLEVNLSGSVVYYAAFGVSADTVDNKAALFRARDAMVAVDRARAWTAECPAGLIRTTGNTFYDGLLDFTLKGNGTIWQNTSTHPSISVYNPFKRECAFRISGELNSPIRVFTGHRFNSVSVGSKTITMTTAGEAANYQAGDLVLLHGYVVQNTGYSPNPQFFDFLEVESVSGAVITFTERLTESYDADWPDFRHQVAVTVGSISLGDQYLGKPRIVNQTARAQGDGTSYYLPKRIRISDIVFRKNPTATTTNQVAVAGLNAEIERCAWEDEDDTFFVCRESKLTTWTNLIAPRGAEPDKIVEKLIIRGGVFGENPDNLTSIANGTGIKTIVVEGADCASRITLVPRDALEVRASKASATSGGDVATNAAITNVTGASFPSKSAVFSGNVLSKLPNQKEYGTVGRTWQNSFTSTSGSAIRVAFVPTTEPPSLLKSIRPGSLVWVTANPLIRGIVAAVKDIGGDVAEITFASGNIGPSILAGTVTASDTLTGYIVPSIAIDGAVAQRPNDMTARNPGLLNWAEMTIESPWTVDGVTVAETGAGGSGDAVSFPRSIRPGRTYALTYDMTHTGGSAQIRDGVAATVYATLDGSTVGSEQSVTFTAGPTAESFELRTIAFNGTITLHNLKEV